MKRSFKYKYLYQNLGTTYSAVAVFRNGVAEIIPNDQGNRTMPSCVAFTPLQRIVGEGAVSQAVTNPENTVYGKCFDFGNGTLHHYEVLLTKYINRNKTFDGS